MNRKHEIIYRFIRPIASALLYFKFKYRKEMAENLPENYIVVANHLTNWDSLFVATAFKKQMYFVASEHLARQKYFPVVNALLKPIIRRKGTKAVSTVKEVIKVTRKGGNVAIFAEGDRCWDGISCPIMPATGKMIKSAKCGMVTYRLEGGFFLNPRWSMTMRKGYVAGKMGKVYTKEQVAAMSPEEINEALARDLFEDAYVTQEKVQCAYKGKKLAEGMENLLFYCPECGKMDSFISEEDTVTCRECGHSFRYTEYGMLEGTKFDTIRDFSLWQQQKASDDARSGAAYTAETAKLVEIDMDHNEVFAAEGAVYLDKDKLVCGSEEFLMEDIVELAIHSRSCIVFTANKKYYEMRAPERVNVYKLTLLYNEYKKMQK